MRVFGRRCPFGKWRLCTPATATAGGGCTWGACLDGKEALFSTFSQPLQDQCSLNHAVKQRIIFLVMCTLHTCKWSSLSRTAFLYSDGLPNDKLFKGKWNSKLKKNNKKSMEITWEEICGLDQVASCVAEAGPEQPWASQQRSLQPAAATRSSAEIRN